MNKILTIAIPAYNAEPFLEKCLDSLLGEGMFQDAGFHADPRLEIIVVNDGSTDRTSLIAGSYVERFPEIVHLINKQNGGHGSGINAGIDHASGKYFKVLDSDDWAETAQLESILDALEKLDSDAVVTGYRSVNVQSGRIQNYTADILDNGTACTETMEQFAGHFEQFPASFQFHGLCYNTSFYRNTGFRMTEKVFYEDQEYAILPFSNVKTITFLPFYFYCYRVGDSGQSVSFQNLDKYLPHMKKVLENIIGHHQIASGSEAWNAYQEQYFVKRLSIAVTSLYAVLLVKAADRKKGREEAAAFRAYLEKEEPAVARNTEKKYKTMHQAGCIPGLAGTYARFADSDFFIRFKKIWNR